MAEVHADRTLRGKEVLGVGDVARSLTRIACEIVERNGDSDNLVIASIPTRGTTLTRRLVNRIREAPGIYTEFTITDTTMYRDDLASQPLRAPKETLAPRTNINGRTVALIDDVLYTGRTIKATPDTLTRIGRPEAVQLAILVNRGHRELPIRPNYVGKNLPTSRDEIVTILLDEANERDGVLLGEGLQTMNLSYLISIRDSMREEAILIPDTAEQMAATQRHGVKKLSTLQGKTIVNLFFEGSTRTRISFETAAKRLSADVINFQSRGSSVSKDESLKDTAPMLEVMSADTVIVHHSSSDAAHRLAHTGWMNLPTLNVGDDTRQHPARVLLDAITLRRYYALSLGENRTAVPGSGLDGAHIVIVRDVLHSRVTRSNVDLLTLLGARVTLVTPPMLLPIGVETWSCATSYSFGEALATHPDVVIMLRVQRERMSSAGDRFFPSPGACHTEYGLTPARFAALSPNAAVVHPDPMNRSLKIYAEAAGSDQSVITERVSNDVCIRMTALYLLLASEGHSND